MERKSQNKSIAKILQEICAQYIAKQIEHEYFDKYRNNSDDTHFVKILRIDKNNDELAIDIVRELAKDYNFDYKITSGGVINGVNTFQELFLEFY